MSEGNGNLSLRGKGEIGLRKFRNLCLKLRLGMEHKFLKINLLVGFLTVAGASLLAQEAARIRNFAPTEYAAQNQNWALAQSPENWLFVANNGGLLEFDGTRWRTFFLPERQTVRSVANLLRRSGQMLPSNQ